LSRRADLEQSIRECYGIIRDYEKIIETTDRPEVKARARREMDEQWELVRGYLDEYRVIPEDEWPQDIVEIAARFSSEATNAPPEPPPGSTERLPWRWILAAIAILVVIASIAWLIVQPGFEPLISLLTAIGSLLAILDGNPPLKTPKWLVALLGALIGIVVVVLVLCALAPQRVALETDHDTYVTALGEDKGYDVVAKTVVIDDFEIFTLIDLGDGRVAFKTFHHRYLSARPEKEDWVIGGAATALLDWEKFAMDPQDDGTVALKTFHDRYVTAFAEDKGWDVIAETEEILDFEKFEIVPVGFCTKMRAFFGFVLW
jgi:hypothetical protein